MTFLRCVGLFVGLIGFGSFLPRASAARPLRSPSPALAKKAEAVAPTQKTEPLPLVFESGSADHTKALFARLEKLHPTEKIYFSELRTLANTFATQSSGTILSMFGELILWARAQEHRKNLPDFYAPMVKDLWFAFFETDSDKFVDVLLSAKQIQGSNASANVPLSSKFVLLGLSPQRRAKIIDALQNELRKPIHQAVAFYAAALNKEITDIENQ